MTKLQVQLLHADAKIPIKAHSWDAGWDIFSVANVDIKPGETVKVPTGISICPPNKYQVSCIWDRSSLASKGIHRLAGILDSGYTGEVWVVLTNLNIYPVLAAIAEMPESLDFGGVHQVRLDTQKAIEEATYHVKIGDKIAQMIIHEFVPCEIEVVDKLKETDRNINGFGSSGV